MHADHQTEIDRSLHARAHMYVYILRQPNDSKNFKFVRFFFSENIKTPKMNSENEEREKKKQRVI